MELSEEQLQVVLPPSTIPVESLPYWGRGPGEDITRLPSGWEGRITPEGRVFFVDHNLRQTYWAHPKTKLKYRVSKYLSYGWQVFKDDDDVLVYVDHLEGVSTRIDPRLLNKIAYDFPEQYGIKSFNPLHHRIKPYATCDDVLDGTDLQGKVAIVTGANSGLGFETARCLASHGCHVILACRDSTRGTQAVRQIQERHPNSKVEYRDLDLSSLKSVKLFSEFFIASGLPLHILVCNAGVFEPNFILTEDNVEKHFGVNYLGHYYLISLLMDTLLKLESSRIVIVTSESHWYPTPKSSHLDLKVLKRPLRDSYNAFAAYGSSKLCCLLLAQELHRQYSGRGVSCNSVHPGNLLSTNLMRNANCAYRVAQMLAKPLTSSVAQASSTIVFCAAHKLMEGISGLYMYRCSAAEPSSEAQSVGTATALWELSKTIVSERTAKWGTPLTSLT